jgi:hypothetical protein
LDLTPWKIKYKNGWDIYFCKFDPPIQKRILKKIEHMKQPLFARGLHSSALQVEEVGQYRIAFYPDEETKTKEIHFVGTHKQYEKWYKDQ